MKCPNPKCDNIFLDYDYEYTIFKNGKEYDKYICSYCLKVSILKKIRKE